MAYGRSKPADEAAPRPKRSALAQAVAYLARREVPAKKLSDYLKRKGYPAPEIASALERLRKENYLSEERIAGAKARELALRRGYWGRALSARLAAQGIEESARRGAVEGIEKESDPETLARRSLERRYGQAWEQAPERRLASFLERRGYPASVIVSLLRSARKNRRQVQEPS